KAGLAEKRLRMFVDQLENAFTTSFDFCLESAHNPKANRVIMRGKAGEFQRDEKNWRAIRSLRHSIPILGIKSRRRAAQIHGAVRVICLTDLFRVRQAISLRLSFAARAEVD